MLALFKKKKKEKLPARVLGNSCLNCNVSLRGNENFCPDCGQRNNINQLNFRLVLDEFFGSIFTYDSRVWNTAVPLILKPGKVAYKYISGKRKKLVNPFRTYFTVSLLFFLLYGLLANISELRGDSEKFRASLINNVGETNSDTLSIKEKDSIVNAALTLAQKETQIKIDSAIQANNIIMEDGIISMDSLTNSEVQKNPLFKKLGTFYKHYDKNKEQTILEALDTLGYKNNFWNRFHYDKIQKTHDMINGNVDDFNQKIFSNLSIAIFLFLPVFALFLKLIYLRRKYTYMEHMVFVFYTQSVFFLIMILFLIVYSFSNNKDAPITIAAGLFAIYLLLAMKTFYKQGWIKTIIKYAIANFSFMIIATFGFALLTMISFIFY